MDERPYRYLMRLYASVGQTAVAIEQFNACRQIVEAAGLALEAETVQLYQQIWEMHNGRRRCCALPLLL
ncbi:MAG: bacterial transcriptional activator domain-containing protein [Anaerolineae bacterium]